MWSAAVIVGKHELGVKGVGEKGADGAPALSNMWGKKHDWRGLEVVMNICEKSESRRNNEKKRIETEVYGGLQRVTGSFNGKFVDV